MILPALYHWAPTERRDDIFQLGLVPNRLNTTSSVSLPHICLSTTPSNAWAMSGGTGWTEIEDWDLWQVRLNENDNVHIRPEFGNIIQEIKVRNVITPDRIWLVGSRKEV